MSIITLTTDFGLEDEYVGVMKGVIHRFHPDVTVIDITHHIQPQDVIQAAYTIESAYPYFPIGTVHIVIVDPGVGSDRGIIALEKQEHLFLAPNNGVLSLLVDDKDMGPIIHVSNHRYFLESVSQTFHGRDIFAPVGAHMSLGVPISDFGDGIGVDDIVRLDSEQPSLTDTGITGRVVSIDHFGNLISNITRHHLKDRCAQIHNTSVEVKLGVHTIRGLSSSYESSKENQPLAIIGSRGMLEIAVNKGSAQQYFKAMKGDIITVRI